MLDYKDEPENWGRPKSKPLPITFKPSEEDLAKIDARLKHKKQKVSGAEPKKKEKPKVIIEKVKEELTIQEPVDEQSG